MMSRYQVMKTRQASAALLCGSSFFSKFNGQTVQGFLFPAFNEQETK
jgi:hypothetical protein